MYQPDVYKHVCLITSIYTFGSSVGSYLNWLNLEFKLNLTSFGIYKNV